MFIKAYTMEFLDCRCRAAAIQERVTAVLRSIPKEAFADSFQKLYERCQQCAVKDGDYFEGQ
jgi:methylmalonyl-CoA mutase cobalamin-binding subunit